MKLHGKFCWKLKISLLNWQKTNKYLFRQVFFCLRTDGIFFTKFCKSHFLPIRYLLCLSLFFWLNFHFHVIYYPYLFFWKKYFWNFGLLILYNIIACIRFWMHQKVLSDTKKHNTPYCCQELRGITKHQINYVPEVLIFPNRH